MADSSFFLFLLLILQLLHSATAQDAGFELDFPQQASGNGGTNTGSDQLLNRGAAEQEAIASVEKAELFLLEDKYDTARSQLASAKKSVHDCKLSLLSSDALVNMQAATKTVALLTATKIEQVESDEDDSDTDGNGGMPMFEPATISGTVKPCLPTDGTTCPYTKCGAGKLLPACATGFAAGVVGGAKGQSYVVTTAEDNPTKPSVGSLRYGVGLGGVGLGGDDTGGVWITFAKSMVIVLQEMLWVRSYTTIDGRNVNVTINGCSIVLAGVTDVILHNFQINSVGDSDTVHIFAGTKKVWADHITSFNAKLGLLSVLQGSTDVTISNCHLTNPNFNMLLGASDADIQDQIMRVTVYRNWFKESMQRMPHCRWGYCHVINNLYTDWGYYAIGGRVHAKIRSEANVFIGARRKEVTPWFQGAGAALDMTPTIESIGDLLLNGSTFYQFQQFGPAVLPQYRSAISYPPKLPTTSLAMLVQRCAGALFGTALAKCMAVA